MRTPQRGSSCPAPDVAAVVVEADPVADGARRVLDTVEPLAVNALLLDRPDDSFDHAVLPVTCPPEDPSL